MAFLQDIPKYAFGTAYPVDLEGEDDFVYGATSSKDASTGSGSSCNISRPRDIHSHGGPQDIFTPGQVKQLVADAIRLGVRHFDCAPLYRTQPLIGQVFREATKELPRQKLFVTSKVPPNMMRPENLERSVRKSIEELQVGYLDLVLIHAPFSTKHVDDNIFYPQDEWGNLKLDDTEPGDEESLLVVAWRKLAELKRQGLTRFIGLSNLNMEQITRIHAIHKIDVIQNEYHIYHQDREIFDHCEELDIHFEAYAVFGSPLTARIKHRPNCFDDSIVRQVARKHRLSIAQLIIEWVHQQPLSYVIRCDTVAQLGENLAAFQKKKFILPLNDLIELDSLNRNVRIHHFKEYSGVEKHREYPFNY